MIHSNKNHRDPWFTKGKQAVPQPQGPSNQVSLGRREFIKKGLLYVPPLFFIPKWSKAQWQAILSSKPPAAGGGGNAWTLVGTPTNSESTNTITCGNPGTGNLLVIYAATEGTGVSYTGCTRGADTLTAANLSTHGNNALTGRFFYMLASSSDGTTVATCTATGTPEFQKIFGWVFSATGTHALDANPTGNSGTSGTPASTAFSSTVDVGVAIGGLGLYGSRDRTLEKIGSNTATTINEFGTTTAGSSWDYLFAAALSSVTANCSITSVEWVCNGISFKST